MTLSSHKLVIIAIILAVLAIGVFLVFEILDKPGEVVPDIHIAPQPVHEVIGTSVEGRSIDAYTYGSGDTRLLFVGGVHGGYEWNSVLLAYQFLDYLDDNPEAVPDNLKITVIPSANPDGLFLVTGKEGRFTLADITEETPTVPGRFNANDVDLNRNFDCKWQAESMWRGNTVSAGTEAFSEPEARAIRDFVLREKPDAAIFWHSQADAVYASECENGILPETLTLMNAYSGASGYKPVDSFDAYTVTGDVEGWLASIGIPAITVELSTHETVEFDRNLAGTQAVLDLYSGTATAK